MFAYCVPQSSQPDHEIITPSEHAFNIHTFSVDPQNRLAMSSLYALCLNSQWHLNFEARVPSTRCH